MFFRNGGRWTRAEVAALLAAEFWVVFAWLPGLLAYISTTPIAIGAPLIAAAATITATTAGVVLGKYFERRRELDALFRDRKVEIYQEFLQELYALLHGSARPDLDQYLQKLSRDLCLWCGPEVVEAFLVWKREAVERKNTVELVYKCEAFLLAMRADLRHDNRGLRRGLFARMVLRQGELLASMYEKNPLLTFAEFAAAEKIADAARAAGKT